MVSTVATRPVAPGKPAPFVRYVPPSAKRPPAAARPQPAAKKTPKAPHEYPAYDTSVAPAFAASPKINPAELYKVLEVAPYVRIDFDSEKELMRFRHNLYTVNVQGKFRYATRREGWSSLIVLRLK